MTRHATLIPDETSVLCEGCGYTLDGLPPSGQCPECGLPITASTGADGRTLPGWEDASRGGSIRRFLLTSAAVVFRTGSFYRTLATRRHDRAALRFARAHWALSSILFAGALSIHAFWFNRYQAGPHVPGGPWAFWAIMTPITYAFISGTTHLAARLTAWEAAYRGLRLPMSVVLRGLYYHAAHFLPVALVAFVTVAGNWVATRQRWISELHAVPYLFLLCGEVLAGAAYLFITYWTGMKNTMYANR